MHFYFSIFFTSVYTLAQLFKLNSNSVELSALARRGSGSACRSLFGGFVHWHKEGPCSAQPIAGADHWPELHCMVAVVSSQEKTIGSTEGMRRSVETSSFLKHRVHNIVPRRVEEMQQAILTKNFQQFARLTMEDSNQFHAVCLDTYPPLFYLNGTSQAIIQLVHRYNNSCGELKVAYTFDAGPNAVLIMKDADLGPFAALVRAVFCGDSTEFYRGLKIPEHSIENSLFDDLIQNNQLKGSVQYVISCKIGNGPQKC